MVSSKVKGGDVIPQTIEIGKTHVYLRNNIELKTNEENENYYEWDEEVMLLSEYMNQLCREDELAGIAIILTNIMQELDGV